MPKVSVDQASSAVEGCRQGDRSWPRAPRRQAGRGGRRYELQHAAMQRRVGEGDELGARVRRRRVVGDAARLRDDAIDRATNQGLRLRAYLRTAEEEELASAWSVAHEFTLTAIVRHRGKVREQFATYRSAADRARRLREGRPAPRRAPARASTTAPRALRWSVLGWRRRTRSGQRSSSSDSGASMRAKSTSSQDLRAGVVGHAAAREGGGGAAAPAKLRASKRSCATP